VSEVYGSICVEKILVSLDSSKHSFAALQAALSMAHHYNASIKGVFVEDITLLNLAEMPFHQEVGEYSATVREISSDGISRGIFVQSKWVIRTFQKLINRTNLRSDFVIRRGKVNDIISRESEECDILILGKSGTNPLGYRQLGSTAKALIQKGQKNLLLVEDGNEINQPLIVLYDHSPAGQTAIETGKDHLNPGETLILLVSEDNPDEFDRDKIHLTKWARENQINISIQTYTSRSFDYTIERIKDLKTGLLILPYIQNSPQEKFVAICLEKIYLPILLIQIPRIV